MLKEEGENFLSFVFVRHPLDRLESAYYDKIAVKYGKTTSPYWEELVTNIHKKCKHIEVWYTLRLVQLNETTL